MFPIQLILECSTNFVDPENKSISRIWWQLTGRIEYSKPPAKMISESSSIIHCVSSDKNFWHQILAIIVHKDCTISIPTIDICVTPEYNDHLRQSLTVHYLQNSKKLMHNAGFRLKTLVQQMSLPDSLNNSLNAHNFTNIGLH